MCVPVGCSYLRAACASKAVDEARLALHALAEVYRAARALWPLGEASAGSHVTVMIDELKTCATQADVLSAYTKGASERLEPPVSVVRALVSFAEVACNIRSRRLRVAAHAVERHRGLRAEAAAQRAARVAR